MDSVVEVRGLVAEDRGGELRAESLGRRAAKVAAGNLRYRALYRRGCGRQGPKSAYGGGPYPAPGPSRAHSPPRLWRKRRRGQGRMLDFFAGDLRTIQKNCTFAARSESHRRRRLDGRDIFLDVAQLVAHLVRDQEVAGSSPVIQTQRRLSGIPGRRFLLPGGGNQRREANAIDGRRAQRLSFSRQNCARR